MSCGSFKAWRGDKKGLCATCNHRAKDHLSLRKSEISKKVSGVWGTITGTLKGLVGAAQPEDDEIHFLDYISSFQKALETSRSFSASVCAIPPQLFLLSKKNVPASTVEAGMSTILDETPPELRPWVLVIAM
eukprot:PhF_6_TR41241/c0_g1_i1/m.62353